MSLWGRNALAGHGRRMTWAGIVREELDTVVMLSPMSPSFTATRKTALNVAWTSVRHRARLTTAVWAITYPRFRVDVENADWGGFMHSCPKNVLLLSMLLPRDSCISSSDFPHLFYNIFLIKSEVRSRRLEVSHIPSTCHNLNKFLSVFLIDDWKKLRPAATNMCRPVTWGERQVRAGDIWRFQTNVNIDLNCP